MSQKRAKQERKNNQVAFVSTITVLKNGNVAVEGIPTNIAQAHKLVSDFNAAINGYFINEAREGRIDDNGTLIQTKIQTPTPKDIERLGKPLNGK